MWINTRQERGQIVFEIQAENTSLETNATIVQQEDGGRAKKGTCTCTVYAEIIPLQKAKSQTLPYPKETNAKLLPPPNQKDPAKLNPNPTFSLLNTREFVLMNRHEMPMDLPRVSLQITRTPSYISPLLWRKKKKNRLLEFNHT